MKRHIAQAILSALEAQGMSKYRLRAESGVSMPIINKIVRGENYHIDSLDKVATTLGVELKFELKPTE